MIKSANKNLLENAFSYIFEKNEKLTDFSFYKWYNVASNMTLDSLDNFSLLVASYYCYRNDNFSDSVRVMSIFEKKYLNSKPNDELDFFMFEHDIYLAKNFVYNMIASIYSVSENEKKKAIDYFKKECTWLIKNIEAEKNRKTFYSFRRINDYSLSDLIKSSVTVMHPSQMNDSVDSLFLPWGEHREKDLKIKLDKAPTAIEKKRAEIELKTFKLFKKALDCYRIRSFSVNTSIKAAITNTLMWAHYAEDHKGIAIEYQFDSSFIDNKDANIVQKIIKVNYSKVHESVAEEQIEINKAFLTKSYDWHYENEYRLISYQPNESSLYYQSQLNDSCSIKAIYFGDKCTKQNIETIISLFENMTGVSYAPKISYYKMEINPYDVYILKAVKIDKKQYLV